MTQNQFRPSNSSLLARAGAAITTGVVTMTIAGVMPNPAFLFAQAHSTHSEQALADQTVARAVSNQDPPRRGDERRG